MPRMFSFSITSVCTTPRAGTSWRWRQIPTRIRGFKDIVWVVRVSVRQVFQKTRNVVCRSMKLLMGQDMPRPECRFTYNYNPVAPGDFWTITKNCTGFLRFSGIVFDITSPSKRDNLPPIIWSLISTGTDEHGDSPICAYKLSRLSYGLQDIFAAVWVYVSSLPYGIYIDRIRAVLKHHWKWREKVFHSYVRTSLRL